MSINTPVDESQNRGGTVREADASKIQSTPLTGWRSSKWRFALANPAPFFSGVRRQRSEFREEKLAYNANHFAISPSKSVTSQ